MSEAHQSADALRSLLDGHRQRWERGDRVTSEAFLDEHPELRDDRDLVLDLVYQEIVVRQERGEVPALDEYRRRFPDFADELTAQFEVEAALELDFGADASAATLALGPGAETEVALPTVPGFALQEVLGHGGMGVVYKARQLGLNRLVALKMMRFGPHASPSELARFRTEAEAVARLQHLHIVQIFEVGEHAGQPFIALELLERSLAKHVAGTPVAPRQAAQWVETLARAVHHAHQHGVLHRDLKPANVLINRDGLLKLTDFGMARLDAHRLDSPSTGIQGTPSYMAPEQALGARRLSGVATDVYGLGAILYELLTGRPPFRGANLAETLDQVRNEEPTPPSALQPQVPRDLETICLTCLRKEPAQRYASAAALGEDVRAFLAGEPIRSRRPGRRERLIRWARRRPAEAALLAAGVMALVGLCVGLIWSGVLAVAAMAGLSLLLGSWWYSARLRGALRDVKDQQLITERYVERLHLLLDMTRQFMRTTERDALLRLLAETTARLANAELATIFVLEHATGELVSRVTLDQEVGEIRLPLGVGIAGTVALTGQPINIPAAYADARFNPEVDRRTGFRTRNLLAVPLVRRDGSILGVFQVINKRDGAFTLEDIDILSTLAASAATGLERSLCAEPDQRVG